MLSDMETLPQVGDIWYPSANPRMQYLVVKRLFDACIGEAPNDPFGYSCEYKLTRIDTGNSMFRTHREMLERWTKQS